VSVKRTEVKHETSQLSTGRLKDVSIGQFHLFVDKHTVNAIMHIVPRPLNGQR